MGSNGKIAMVEATMSSEISQLVSVLQSNYSIAQTRFLNKGPGHFVRTRLAAVSALSIEVLSDQRLRDKLSLEEIRGLLRLIIEVWDLAVSKDGNDFDNFTNSQKFLDRRDLLVEAIQADAGSRLLRISESSYKTPDSNQIKEFIESFSPAILPESKQTKAKASDQISETEEFDTPDFSESESESDWAFIQESSSYEGPSLRSWQVEALDAWEHNSAAGVIEAITGTGKSMVAIAAMHQTLKQGGNCLVLVPTSGLLEQWFRQVNQYLPNARVGKLTSGHEADFNGSDVIIATVQTASRRQPQPRSHGLLVADEVHRLGAQNFSKALNESYPRRLGLSATYERQNDDGVSKYLEPYFGSVIFAYGYKQALADQVVAPFHLGMVGTDFTPYERGKYELAEDQCRKARTYLVQQCDYPEEWALFFAYVQATLKRGYKDKEFFQCAKYIEGFSTKRTLLAEATAKEKFLGAISPAFNEQSRALVFTETKESAYRVAHILSKGAVARPLTGDSPGEERERVLKDFGSGKVQVVCAPRILDEGIDVPEAEWAIIVAASRSKRQMIQRMGRVIRLKADGRPAKILLTYIKDSSEDPNYGGHEAFLEEVRGPASSVTMFDSDKSLEVEEWLGGTV